MTGESCADQMIGGLYIHDPRLCKSCLTVADRQMQKPSVRWRFHEHRGMWSFSSDMATGISSGEVTDDGPILRLISSGRFH